MSTLRVHSEYISSAFSVQFQARRLVFGHHNILGTQTKCTHLFSVSVPKYSLFTQKNFFGLYFKCHQKCPSRHIFNLYGKYFFDMLPQPDYCIKTKKSQNVQNFTYYIVLNFVFFFFVSFR